MATIKEMKNELYALEIKAFEEVDTLLEANAPHCLELATEIRVIGEFTGSIDKRLKANIQTAIDMLIRFFDKVDQIKREAEATEATEATAEATAETLQVTFNTIKTELFEIMQDGLMTEEQIEELVSFDNELPLSFYDQSEAEAIVKQIEDFRSYVNKNVASIAFSATEATPEATPEATASVEITSEKVKSDICELLNHVCTGYTNSEDMKVLIVNGELFVNSEKLTIDSDQDGDTFVVVYKKQGMHISEIKNAYLFNLCLNIEEHCYSDYTHATADTTEATAEATIEEFSKYSKEFKKCGLDRSTLYYLATQCKIKLKTETFEKGKRKSIPSKPTYATQEEISFRQFLCYVTSINFFGDRVEKGYSIAGFTVKKLTCVNPDRTKKIKRSFSFESVSA